MVNNFSVRNWFFIAFSLVPCAGYASTLNLENYKVSVIYSGEHYQLTSNEQSDEKWMTERKNAMEGPVNLAGNYVVYTVGCGGGTVCGEILNVKTGEVVGSLPNAYYINREGGTAPFALISKADRRLLIVIGVAADPEIGMSGEEVNQRNRQRYYEFADNELHLIKVFEK